MLGAILIVLMVAASSCPRCSADILHSGPQWDIYDLLDSLGLKTFSGLLETTGFMYMLSDNAQGPFTVYAPSEDAFKNLPPSVVKKLQNDDNWSLIHDVTSYHITRGNLSFLNWTNNMLVPTFLDGKSIRLNIYKNKTGEPSLMSASGATLVKADQEATNGVIQVINKVLYSVPDETASNYIHDNSRLRKLTMLMQVGGYPECLDKQNVTFFAPSDEALQELGQNFTHLLTNSSKIKDLFRNHTINNTYYTNGLEILDGGFIINLAGSKLNIRLDEGVKVNGASLVEEDISLSNGVMHINVRQKGDSGKIASFTIVVGTFTCIGYVGTFTRPRTDYANRLIARKAPADYKKS